MKRNSEVETPLVDVAKLRQTTKEAIQRGKEKEAKRLAEVKAANERKALQDQLFAASVLAAVPHKCEQEAGEGRSHAIVMGLKHGRDYEYESNNFNTLSYNRLKGPGAIVWNELVKAGLEPAIEYWHDGMGIDGGFNIIVKW